LKAKPVLLLITFCLFCSLLLAFGEASEDAETNNTLDSDSKHRSPLSEPQAMKDLSTVAEEQQRMSEALQMGLDALLEGIRTVEGSQASVKDSLLSVSLQLHQELEILKERSDELAADFSELKEIQTIVQDDLSDLSSYVDKLRSVLEAKAVSLQSELASIRRLVVCLLILLFLLISFLALIFYQFSQFRKSSHSRSENLINGIAEFSADLNLLSERLQHTDTVKSVATRPADEARSIPQQRVISEYQPPDCSTAPGMITVTTSVLSQLQRKTSEAEKTRPGDEVGFGLVGSATVNWEEIYIAGVLCPGEEAQYSPGSVFEDLDAQSNELRRYQFLTPQVGYQGFAHRHPAAMERPSQGDMITDTANVLDAFEENNSGGFIYPILTAQEKGDGWNISWYYMPRRDLEYFIFTPRIVEAPALPKAWNSMLEYRVQAEISCLLECAETVSLEALERETSYLAILLAANRWNGTSMLFVIPEDYPLIPPAVYLQWHQGEIEDYQSQLVSGWQPAYSLANIVFEFDDSS